MASVAVLPRIFRWVFTALEVFCVLAAISIGLAILIDPKLPAGTEFGPLAIDFAGQPGSVALRPANGDSDFTVTAFRGSIVLFVEKAGGLVEVAKRYGLPAILITTIFLIALFDLLRRLFRNVGRGQSFTRQSVYFVQFIGVSLIAYAFVAAYLEGWFFVAMLGYLSEHAIVTISGTQLHLPGPEPIGFRFPLGSAPFLAGLLVLALSEVFRQGLALKSEHDLTV